MKIAITGANGQLGSEFRFISNQYEGYTFDFLDREKLDIGNEKSILSYFQSKQSPDLLINCAAYTAVDKAEEEIELAQLINAKAPHYLAKACAEFDCKLIHYSSDYVYHINKDEGLVETDLTQPKGVYAATKLEGEKLLLGANPNAIIIRTSWVYSSFGNNFVKTMIRLGKDRDRLNIVSDQIGTPTYARDIAESTMQVIKQIANPAFENYGIYNFSNAGITNWADFAKKIFELENIKCEVYPITSAEFGAKADRPLWSVLSKEKIETTFGLKINHWEESLKKCLEELRKTQH